MLYPARDHVSAGSGWRRRAHLNHRREGPDGAPPRNGADAVAEEGDKCVEDGCSWYTEGGRDGVGACSAQNAGDGSRTAYTADFLLVMIRKGSYEQKSAYGPRAKEAREAWAGVRAASSVREAPVDDEVAVAGVSEDHASEHEEPTRIGPARTTENADELT